MSKVAFVFPGQGSQKVGMGRSFVEDFPLAKSLFDQANQILGFDLAKLCFEGPEDALRETQIAQPALFTVSVIAWSCLQSKWDKQPSAVAGHSVGEYAALVASGVLTFSDGLKLVRKRGELMADLAKRRPGSMSAILGLEAKDALEACLQAKSELNRLVSVANYNGGGQIVISGETVAVERASEIAKEKGAKRVIPLPVSGGFHSPLMVSAGDALYEQLIQTTMRIPQVPIVINVTADYARHPDDLLGGLTMQVSRSVRWEESMQRLLADGFDTFIELGSGDVLSGLMRRIDKSARTISVSDSRSLVVACDLLNGASKESTSGASD